MRNKGFTLAEVLITLAIIGVVASITIPALQKNINKMEITVAQKKLTAEMFQTALNVRRENGGSYLGLCDTTYDNFCMMNKFLDNMNYTKKCAENTGSGNCWPSEWTNIDGDPAFTPSFHATAVLNNGAMVLFRYHDSACTIGDTPMCGWSLIDVNGFKKPNKAGEDIIHFKLFKDKLEMSSDYRLNW